MKKYLICYGEQNQFWLCDAEDHGHAVEQFEAADMDETINSVFECLPSTNRYFVRQRRAMWVCYVQEVEAVNEDAAIDAFHDTYDPQHSFIEEVVRHQDYGPVTAFDQCAFPDAEAVFHAD
ncbi:hypothetical protein L6Q21_09740 [Sandaracinobacter sp. RS1-74]|uniref:hypothetical protein n=1 Tax=Sandaracinobacteroides sayramensis TaxID=2913411 RepID=UPI001EDBB688|nr:hypothetical protein [Sandaracinobacteroides sayramensis]MCG2841261.1 hypothetical protein [Sandaracinobacteroides sayramensis]